MQMVVIAINYTLDVPKDLDEQKEQRIKWLYKMGVYSIIIKVDNCSPYLRI